MIQTSLIRRTIQSPVVCSSDFSWADNQQGLSPCTVAAFVDAACEGNNFTVPQLPNGDHYSISTPNSCSCSWASYNLLAACTACQGQSQSILNWAAYQDNCTGHLSSDTYFPAGTVIQGNTKIPFWATTNPDNWSNGRFNTDQAKSVANQDKPDVGPPSAHKATPAGAIAGGVVGAVVVIALGLAIVLKLCSRKRKANNNITAEEQQNSQRPALHGRSFSDLSQKTMGTIYGHYAPALATIPSSPTIRSRSDDGTNVLSYYGSAQSTVFSAPLQTFQQISSSSPADPQSTTPDGHITPFIVQGPAPPASPGSPVSAHRKMASESSDTTQAVSRYEDGSADGHASPPNATRRNPPAYTPSADAPQAQQPQAHGHHVHRTSDAQSFTSYASGPVHDPNVLAGRIAFSLSGAGRSGTSVVPVNDNDDPNEIPLA